MSRRLRELSSRLRPRVPGRTERSLGRRRLAEAGAGEEVLVEADALLERGSFSVEKYGLADRAASKGGKLSPVLTPGRMRYSVATWAINAVADPAQVSAFLNHKNPRTTRKFYATHAVATKVPTLL